ncbi:MAG: DUF1918 domain-containing protein [Acidimicrobiales bacterium]
MSAQPGDRIVFPARDTTARRRAAMLVERERQQLAHLAETERQRACTIVEVQGDDGGPPFLVRWDDPDSGSAATSLLFPSRRIRVEAGSDEASVDGAGGLPDPASTDPAAPSSG